MSIQEYIDQGHCYFAFNFEGELLQSFAYRPKKQEVEKPFPSFFGMVAWESNKFSEAWLYEFENGKINQSKAPPIYLKDKLDALDGKLRGIFLRATI